VRRTLVGMHQRRIGSGGFQVGAIGLGCRPLSPGPVAGDGDDERSLATIERAVDLGVTLFDTADAYGPYTNELLLGRALRRHRDRVVLATKCGLISHPELGMLRNGRPEHIRKACDASLRRLRVDCIDLYQLHRVDPAVPLEESWEAMADLVREGKVRALGLCDVSVTELRRAMAVFPVTAVQVELSVTARDQLRTVVPWCAEYGVGVLAVRPPALGRLAHHGVAAHSEGLARVAARHSRRHVTEAQLALAWVLAVADHVVPIAEATSPDDVTDIVAAADLVLDGRDREDLSGSGAPETAGVLTG
jgi:aryl-alcohol dehydrogenase-like predicted oxidoreductase